MVFLPVRGGVEESLLSLRLGQGTALTPHCGVIHSRAQFDSPRFSFSKQKDRCSPVLLFGGGEERRNSCAAHFSFLIVLILGAALKEFAPQILEEHDNGFYYKPGGIPVGIPPGSWWRRGESNSCPKICLQDFLRA